MALKLNPLASQPYNFPSSARPPISTFRSPKFLCLASSSPALTSKEVETLKKPFTPPKEVHVQVLHSMPPQKIEIFKSMEGWAEQNLLTHLKDVEKSWQPQDFLPDPASDGFEDQVRELRERARELPDDYFVVLVGDMITEEALPTYQTMLNTLDGVRDETGASPTSWAIWTRAWTAEENRHGDLLNKYLYLSGRVDMRQIEKTIQYLIGSGMDPRTENNPYLGFIYTSFQERATFVSHGNTARHAKEHGDLKLAQICGTIAADEKRHETAYTKIVEKLFEIDPDGTVMAFADMMRKKISMPAHLMYDGRDDSLFDNFSSVAQRLGVYTAKDYADILEFLVGRWKIENLKGLSGEGNKAQDYLCGLTPRIRRLDERAQARAKKGPKIPFSWIHDREVQLYWRRRPSFSLQNPWSRNDLIVNRRFLDDPPSAYSRTRTEISSTVDSVPSSAPTPHHVSIGTSNNVRRQHLEALRQAVHNRHDSTRHESNSRSAAASQAREEVNVLKYLTKETYNPVPKSQLLRNLSLYYKNKNSGLGCSRNPQGYSGGEGEKRCAVCLEDFRPKETVMLTPCKHMFHEECIVPWLKSKGQCPVCRFVILTPTKRDSSPSISPDLAGDMTVNDLFTLQLISMVQAMEETFLFGYHHRH